MSLLNAEVFGDEEGGRTPVFAGLQNTDQGGESAVDVGGIHAACLHLGDNRRVLGDRFHREMDLDSYQQHL